MPRSILLGLIILLCLFPGQPAQSQTAPGALTRKILLDNAESAAADGLLAAGGQRLVDYGAFSLWTLPPIDSQRVSSAARAMLQDFLTLDENIYLRGGVISAEQKAAGLLPGAAGEGFWLVQFIGPVLPEWEQALRSAGLQVAAYVPNYAYIVWGSRPADAVQEVAAKTQAVQWDGPFSPAYRLAPALAARRDTPAVDISVQVINTPRLAAVLAEITARAAQIYQRPDPILNTTRISLRIGGNQLEDLAALPGVINIEPYRPPEMLDEIQGQIIAAHSSVQNGALVASSPGYLQWLEQKGFPSNPQAYPLVDVVDDGVDTGDTGNILHPDLHQLGNTGLPSRVEVIRNCTSEASGNSVGGHGSLNASILGGYNDLSGLAHEDALGFQYGLGISPFGRMAATKIFNNAGKYDSPNCGSISAFAAETYASGTRITSNSWGGSSNTEYDSDTMAYDAMTRDASPEPGDQSMLHIFAAGNDGASNQAATIASPGTAKNVLTVGASENPRGHNIADGCGVANSDSANDVALFSSIGPTAGGRAKPDILAPGTHVQGAASQDSAFTGITVCGSIGNKYYPSGQTLYTWSSGTSHSTPAVSGAAQLIYNYYARILVPGHQPGPAMIKALILNTPRYMVGTRANDNLPSPYQGWGSIDLGKIFDDTPRILIDQSIIFDRSGKAYKANLRKTDSSLPVRVSLVWTDAPAIPNAALALVNNLDLEITYEGQVYRGDRFNGPYSVPNGPADSLNNVENIFLPPGAGTDFQVRVVARNIAGDGLPNRPGATDQDFALVIYNAREVPLPIHSVWLPIVVINQAAP